MLEDIVKNVLKGNITGEEISERCSNREEYNRFLLDIVSIPIQMYIEEEQIEDGLETISEEIEEDSDYSIISDSVLEMKNILEEYYKIENCPSFLYHDGLLNDEDYRFGVEIYGKIFGLKYEEGCSEALRQVMEEYIRRVMSRSIKWNTEEEMMKDLFY